MTKPDLTDTELDTLFETARTDVPEMDASFLAKLDADAAQVLQAASSQIAPSAGWSALRNLLGGWRGLGGLVAACLTGLWIGVSPPEVFSDHVSVIEAALTGQSSDYDALIGGWNMLDSDAAFEEGAGDV